jgi:hypothetical protein
MKLEAFKNSVEIRQGKHHPNVTDIHFDRVGDGWRQMFMLRGDAHYDNVHCRQDIELRDLERAKELNAGIIDIGDLFCAMQGRGDPRSDYDALRPEHKRSDYINALVEVAAKRYRPYAPQWWLMGKGNHETAVLKNKNVDLTSMLAYDLNTPVADAHASAIQVGGYGGWVRFHFTMRKTVKYSINLKYFHGAGGGGPVTRGVIDTNRQAVYLPDADIVVNGHTHDNYIVPVARERFGLHENISHDYLWFIRTPTYKDEYGDGGGGFHIERGRPPKPVGCVFGEFYYEEARINLRFWSELS